MAYNSIVGTDTANNIVVNKTSGDDSVTALGGNDTLIGSGSNDIVDLGTGNDSLSTAVNYSLGSVIGGTGNDTIYFDEDFISSSVDGDADKIPLSSRVMQQFRLP